MRWILAAGALAAAAASLGGCFLLWLTPPGVPTGIEASDGSYLDRIVVSWSAAARATGYEVWRAASEGGTYAKVGEAAGTTWSDTEVTVNTTYWYRVKACNRAGCSDLSAPDSGYAAGEGTPSVPTGVSATDGAYTDRVRVTWDGALGATQYEVWRDVARDGPYNLRGTVTGTTYDDRDASPGVVYWYKVKACNALGCSAFSAPDSGFTFATAPDPVTNVQASDGTYNDRVRVTWTASAGAASYEVHRATSEGGTYTLRGTSTGTSYDDTGVTVGTTYWYRVRACNTAGCSAFSVPDPGFASTAGGGGGGGGGGGTPDLPGQPQGVSASDGEFTDRVRITWSGVSGATSYQVLRADQDTGPFVQIGSTTTSTTYDDLYQTASGKPALCQEYWYAVRACNASGCGLESVPDKGYRGAPTPPPPTGVSASDGLYPDKIVITWNAVTGAKYYEVYAQTTSNMYGTYGYIGQTTSTTFHHTGLLNGVTYYYRVKTCVEGTGSSPGICGCSSLSTFDQGSTCSVPAKPTSVAAAPVSGGIQITWTQVGGLRYEIWRSTDNSNWGTAPLADFAVSPYTDFTTGTKFYKLRTCNACGCSDFSDVVSATAGP